MARRFTGSRLVVASHNPGKVREIGDLLRPFGVETVSAGACGRAPARQIPASRTGAMPVKVRIPRPEPQIPTAAFWAATSSVTPLRARRSMARNCSSVKTAPSAEPCSSTRPPDPVMTKLASVPAALSSA